MGNSKSKKQKDKSNNNNSSNIKAAAQQPTTKVAPNQKQPSPNLSSPQSKESKPRSGTSLKSSTKEADVQAFSAKRLEEVFNKYKDEEDDQVIGPSGMERFCADLEADPEDVVFLVMAYHLNASSMGFFTKEEFTKGFGALGLDSIEKIKKHLEKFKSELDEPANFKNIYRFAFDFAKEQEQKCIDMEMAQGLIELLLVDRFSHAKPFLEFLKQQETYKGMNSDQWSSLLEFSKTMNKDFSNYDENGAWPCILDEYVEWATKQQEETGEPASS